MSLDVNNFNLFAKKPAANKPVPKPMPVAVTSPEVVEEEIKKFDAEVEVQAQVDAKNETAEMNSVMNDNFSVEIERFEDIKPTSVMNTITMEKAVQSPSRMIEKTRDVPSRMKYESYVPLTFRISEEHDLELKKIEHFIMRNRRKGVNTDSRERITTNTVVRAMIANFLERAGDMDLSNIDNEEMLKERMEKAFKQKYNKKN